MGNACAGLLKALLSSASPVANAPAAPKARQVVLSSLQRGPHVKCNAGLVGGEGVVLASSAAEQDYCYFEVRLVDLPPDADFSVGVARQSQEPLKDFAQGNLGAAGEPGWGLSASTMASLEMRAGDVIGVYIDQSGAPRVDFALNGKRLGPDYALPRSKAEEIRGQIYPAVSVGNGASLECVFDEAHFKHLSPTESFKSIIVAREML